MDLSDGSDGSDGSDRSDKSDGSDGSDRSDGSGISDGSDRSDRSDKHPIRLYLLYYFSALQSIRSCCELWTVLLLYFCQKLGRQSSTYGPVECIEFIASRNLTYLSAAGLLRVAAKNGVAEG